MYRIKAIIINYYSAMETSGKTNVEFCNEVNEILAHHEFKFDQVTAAIQTELTKL